MRSQLNYQGAQWDISSLAGWGLQGLPALYKLSFKSCLCRKQSLLSSMRIWFHLSFLLNYLLRDLIIWAIVFTFCFVFDSWCRGIQNLIQEFHFIDDMAALQIVSVIFLRKSKTLAEENVISERKKKSHGTYYGGK